MEKAISKAAVLIEAMPYIQRFRDKVVVIKFGGNAMSDKAINDNVLRDIVFMELVGMKPVLVHGGGSAISEEMKKAGKEPVFSNGLRVTDIETIRIVEKTLFGSVNRELVNSVKKFGGRAKPVSGNRDRIVNAAKKRFFDPENPDKEIDLGYVGEVKKVNPAKIIKICDAGVIPVIAPLGYGKKGEIFNINADHAAAEIAAALKAEKLVFLTNVKGIMVNRGEEEYLIPSINVREIEKLKKSKVITGGMLPKVDSCIHAVKEGVHKTHIIDVKIQHSLLLEIFTDKGIGTEIII
ncbi:MAG: acetylglutamate kinase [Candidatus Aureabacteria bacterium]|nr:acetylglutamate kinase [Candidatus Auribacterota bacterium]